MTTVTPTPEEMNERVARFTDLSVISSQKDSEIPLEVRDLIFSRELKPVITLGGDTNSPFGASAPIEGAAGITITYAICPSGTGPSLHSHKRTYETFTVMQGQFEFFWGDEGEHSVVLNRFDTLSVPPAVNRAFKNVSDEEGVLQVVISGGVHDSRDIAFPRKTAEQIKAHGQNYLEFFQNEAGLHFE